MDPGGLSPRASSPLSRPSDASNLRERPSAGKNSIARRNTRQPVLLNTAVSFGTDIRPPLPRFALSHPSGHLPMRHRPRSDAGRGLRIRRKRSQKRRPGAAGRSPSSRQELGAYYSGRPSGQTRAPGSEERSNKLGCTRPFSKRRPCLQALTIALGPLQPRPGVGRPVATGWGVRAPAPELAVIRKRARRGLAVRRSPRLIFR